MSNWTNWKYMDARRVNVSRRRLDIDVSESGMVTDPDAWLSMYGAMPDDPDPEPVLPPQPPTLAERLEAAEALIDMMLEAGGEAVNG